MDERLKTPEEELAYLKAEIEKKKEIAKGFEHRFDEQLIASDVVRDYANEPLEKFTEKGNIMTEGEKYRLISWLSPKSTDEKVAELSKIMADKGVRNAIEISRNSNDAELEDDFHRFLVQYLLTSQDIKNDVSKDEWKALHMTLYEVILPSHSPESGKGMKEIIGFMEQWYASMQALSRDPGNKDKNYYSLEIAIPNGSSEISFYVAVHSEFSDLFEKVITGVFPQVKVSICKEDYSIFPHNAAIAAAYAEAFTHPALPIKTYKDMEGDPITVILSSFTKLKKEGEGLAIQFMIRPAGDTFVKNYTGMLDDLRRGETLKAVIEKQSILNELLNVAKLMFGSQAKKSDTDKVLVDDNAIKKIQSKLEHTIVETNLRIIAAAGEQSRADSILRETEASFKQFTDAGSNSLVFHPVTGRAQHEFLHRFTYRLFDDRQALPLNIEETSTLFHFPLYVKDIGQLKNSEGKVAQAPLDLPEEGVVIGVNKFRNGTTKIHFGKEDRLRHFYVIGQTGTGKTSMLKNMIIQDIQNGEGCCFIDPHGNDVLDILANIPEERKEDVIYFDPGYVERPMGLNMLEYDKNFPEQKTFVVNELLSIFNKLFDMKVAGGPGFEQYFRNATLLVMDHPESGNTLLEIARVFSDKDFRDYKLSKTKNPLLIQFWQNADKTTGEQGMQNWTQYVTSKFDVFLSNDIMRPIIAQEKSSINFREIMDRKKIFLINLSKGRLGDINSHLLGLIIVGKFLQAALSRSGSDNYDPYYLYIDEFQNVTTPSISTILSEARKYKLSLHMAHQYIGQLSEDIKGAVFGNVGSLAVFRVGPEDAQFLEKHLAPEFTQADLIKNENFHAYIKMLSRGEPKKPFSIELLPPILGNRARIDPLKEMSYLKYGRPKAEIDSEILRKYQFT